MGVPERFGRMMNEWGSLLGHLQFTRDCERGGQYAYDCFAGPLPTKYWACPARLPGFQ